MAAYQPSHLAQAISEADLSAQAEWERLLQLCLTTSLTSLCQPGKSPRNTIQAFIRQGTRERAYICWEASQATRLEDVDRLIEIRRGKNHYGILGLAPGYLASTVMPSIPQCFAQLCGLLLTLLEYELLVQQQLSQMPPANTVEPLTARKQDILHSLARGECEEATATRLGITPNTVRTHRHRLYSHLDVHTPYEAVLQGFALGLLSLLDAPYSG